MIVQINLNKLPEIFPLWFQKQTACGSQTPSCKYKIQCVCVCVYGLCKLCGITIILYLYLVTKKCWMHVVDGGGTREKVRVCEKSGKREARAPKSVFFSFSLHTYGTKLNSIRKKTDTDTPIFHFAVWKCEISTWPVSYVIYLI